MRTRLALLLLLSLMVGLSCQTTENPITPGELASTIICHMLEKWWVNRTPR